MTKTLGTRFKIFGVGTLLGAVVASLLVWQHRQASMSATDRATSAIVAVGLPADLQAAITGTLRYYERDRPPIQHRMVEAARLVEAHDRLAWPADLPPTLDPAPAPPPGHPTDPRFFRELILQGQESGQRLWIRETILPPPPLRTLDPSEYRSEQLEGCLVLAWEVLQPGHLAVTFDQPVTFTEVAAWAARYHWEAVRPLLPNSAAPPPRFAPPQSAASVATDGEAAQPRHSPHASWLVKLPEADFDAVALALANFASATPSPASSSPEGTVEAAHLDPSEQSTALQPISITAYRLGSGRRIIPDKLW